MIISTILHKICDPSPPASQLLLDIPGYKNKTKVMQRGNEIGRHHFNHQNHLQHDQEISTQAFHRVIESCPS